MATLRDHVKGIADAGGLTVSNAADAEKISSDAEVIQADIEKLPLY